MKEFIQNRWSVIVICTLALVIVLQLVIGTSYSPTLVESALRATFDFDGDSISLTDGRNLSGEGDAQVATWMYGLPVIGDISGDGAEDAGVLLLRGSGGSERLFYIAAVLGRSARGTNAIELGENVAVNYCMISDDVLTVSIYEQAEDSPTLLERKRYFTVADGLLIELSEHS